MDDTVEPHVETFAHSGVEPAEVVIAQTRLGAVIALDGATGEPLWRWPTRDPQVSVAHGGAQVYVSAATSDRPAAVAVDLPPDAPPAAGSPVSVRARIPRIKVRSSAITALRASDGDTRWRMTLYSADTTGPVYLTGGVLITSVISFASHAREIIALDAETGELRWSQRIGSLKAFGHRTAGLLWVDDGTIATATEAEAGSRDVERHSFALLDAATGAIRWRGDQAPTDPALERRSVSGDLTISIDQGPAWPHVYVCACRASDGAEVWRVACEGVAGRPAPPLDMLAHEGRVYLLSHTSRIAWTVRIHALNAATGQIMWRWRSPRWLFTLFLLRQALQRIREAQRMRAWRSFWSDALHLRWRYPIRPEGEPAMDAGHGRLTVATYLGVFALRMRDGRQLWHALPFIAVSRMHIAPADTDR